MPRLHPVPTFEKTVCRNPATGEVIGYSPVTSVNAVKRVIGTARAAQKHWSRLAVEQRAACLFRIRDYIVTQADEIAEIIWQDNGKTRVDALSTEVLPAIMAVDYYAKHAKRFLTDRHTPASNVLLWNKRSKVVRVPYGVVGIISPWNYPFSIPFYEMTRPQVIVDGLLFFAKKNMWWHPHGKNVYQGLTGAINFLYA
ncbi:MAG: aldehyde dehydrogenase family protein, partial [Desulfobacterales bacterium]